MRSSADAVLLFLQSDLQDSRGLLPKFVELWERGYETASGMTS